MSKRFFSLALLLLGGQLLTAVSAGKSAAANATLVTPGLLRSARALTQTPSACTDGVTYFTANGIPYTVNNCATCKDGKVGNRLCGWSIDCCSSSGFCGPTEEWCGANCIGGPCGQKITVPSNRLCGSGFRGNGQCTSGCCNERGWCTACPSPSIEPSSDTKLIPLPSTRPTPRPSPRPSPVSYIASDPLYG
ncbi:hypothetical protein V8C86DRAFT_2497175 [Haematococcus lacustris]